MAKPSIGSAVERTVRSLVPWSLALSTALASLVPARVLACGLTPPIGPNGLPTVCDGDEHAIKVRAGLTFGGTATTIEFGDERDELRQSAMAATVDVQVLDGLVFSIAGGAAIAGHVDHLGVRHDLRPGPLGGVGVSYRFLDGLGPLPFAQASFTYSIARSTSHAPDGAEATFTSKDWRVGLVVGKSIAGVIAPFAFFRYFGAGTDWAIAGGHGSDAHRFHAGVGAVVPLSQRFDALAEVAFLGEKRGTLGIGYTF